MRYVDCVMWVQIVYKYIAEDVETRFDTLNDELECIPIERPLPKGKNKKVIWLMIDELGGRIMANFVGSKANSYSYLIDDGSETKIAKGAKMCGIKRKFKFENCKICLEATQLENEIKYLEENKIDKYDIKEFIKNNKSILKIK